MKDTWNSQEINQFKREDTPGVSTEPRPRFEYLNGFGVYRTPPAEKKTPNFDFFRFQKFPDLAILHPIITEIYKYYTKYTNIMLILGIQN